MSRKGVPGTGIVAVSSSFEGVLVWAHPFGQTGPETGPHPLKILDQYTESSSKIFDQLLLIPLSLLDQV